jgi:hypothetical protein
MKVHQSKPSHTPNRYAPCLSSVLRFNICDEKQKEFSKRTLRNMFIGVIINKIIIY